jgi:hypothetical protein
MSYEADWGGRTRLLAVPCGGPHRLKRFTPPADVMHSNRPSGGTEVTNRMKLPLAAAGLLCLLLSACTTDSATSNELLFPTGQHKWSKGADYKNDAPDDNCPNCPDISLSSSLVNAINGGTLSLSSNTTHSLISGSISGTASAGACTWNLNNNCFNEWRVWSPGATDPSNTAQVPGGKNFSSNISFDASFQCGTSRVVIVAENTSGMTRYIFDVVRGGTLCGLLSSGGKMLNVRLTWDEGRIPGSSGTSVDLDLHLVRPAGVYDTGSGDCNYSNCRTSSSNSYGNSNLPWGAASDGSSDPLLDVDNLYGFGPENIFLYKPETGQFKVYVKYFSSSGPSTHATVELYNGSTFLHVLTNTASFLPGEVWHPFDFTVDASGNVTTVDERNTYLP